MIGKVGLGDQGINVNPERLAVNGRIAINNSHLREKKSRIFGSIYTPPELAQLLTSWAIRNPSDRVLDVGLGEGVFVFAAYHRLKELGVPDDDARQQLFGSEIDAEAYTRFMDASREIRIHFPHLQNTNFFDTDIPPIDAIVGNPPYIRRTYIKDVDEIRKKVFERNLEVYQLNMTRMTDMYVYFLLHALPMLRPGGRLAVITADPWMNVSYGEEFKKYLLRHFSINYLISLDRRIFKDAQVKPVLILATKEEVPGLDWPVQFVRVKSGLPLNRLSEAINDLNAQNRDIIRSEVKYNELKTCIPWGIHFKAPETYEKLESHLLMAPIRNVGETRIGIQTLAKGFFVLKAEQVEAQQIEQAFLAPLAQSIRYINEPVIDVNTEPVYHLFCCANAKEDIQDTYAYQYILRGEASNVEVRGKNTTLVGYHNKERIKRSHRKYWYDLRSSIERRGCAPILIPRLVYRNFIVIWNKAGFVPGELFIEFLPHGNVDIEVYLAILTSSICELMLRVNAQIYGGGTFNINPGRIKNVSILNPLLISKQQQEELKQSYLQYVSDKAHNRSEIDNTVYRILGLNKSTQQRIAEILEDLLLLATSSKRLL